MRFRNVTLFVAALSLLVLAAGTLIDVLRPHPPDQVFVKPPDIRVDPARVEVKLPSTVAPPEPDSDIRVIPLSMEGNGMEPTIAVARRAESWHQPGEYRWTLTFYRLDYRGSREAELHYLGSRCIEYDMGADLIEFDTPKSYRPDSFRESRERLQKASKED